MDNKQRRDNDRDYQRGNTILLTIIGVATLLVALVGATFAYFSATVTNNSNQSVNITTAQPVSLVYSGSTLSLENALPGSSNSNTFTVNNPSTSPTAQSYDLKFYIDSNNFATSNGDSLVVTITGSTDGSNTPSVASSFSSGLDVTNSTTYGSSYSANVVTTQVIAVNETHTYTASINFNDTESLDNTNQNKTFTSHIDIENPMSVTG